MESNISQVDYTADTEQLQAAQAEGLVTENPLSPNQQA